MKRIITTERIRVNANTWIELPTDISKDDKQKRIDRFFEKVEYNREHRGFIPMTKRSIN